MHVYCVVYRARGEERGGGGAEAQCGNRAVAARTVIRSGWHATP
jgi:hypothetical protein